MHKIINEILIDLHYFPCIDYFTLINSCDELILEAEEHYVKQSYRNRTYILTSNKIDRLTVPIVHKDKKLPIEQLRIDYKQKWQDRHWRAIKTAYARAPFFEYYGYLFENLIFTSHEYLWQLNKEILTLCLKILNIEIKIRQTDKYIHDYNSEKGGLLDLRSKILPNRNSGIIHAKPYNQLFASTFIKNLSVLDLLFNEGPNAVQVLNENKILFEDLESK